MRKPLRIARRKSARGVVLIEALISVLIFTLAIIGLISVQALVIKNNTQNGYRADATTVAQRVLSDIQLDPVNAGTKAGTYTAAVPGANQWGKFASTTLPSGQVVVAVTAAKQVTVTVSWISAAEMQSKTAAGYMHTYKLEAQLNTNDI